jgi:hypothetical protein
VEDVERDLDAASGDQDLRDALDWLLAAARPLIQNRPDLT